MGRIEEVKVLIRNDLKGVVRCEAGNPGEARLKVVRVHDSFT